MYENWRDDKNVFTTFYFRSPLGHFHVKVSDWQVSVTHIFTMSIHPLITSWKYDEMQIIFRKKDPDLM